MVCSVQSGFFVFASEIIKLIKSNCVKDVVIVCEIGIRVRYADLKSYSEADFLMIENCSGYFFENIINSILDFSGIQSDLYSTCYWEMRDADIM